MLIAWMSKLQPFTVASTHNAELLALALAADECMWLRRTIDELRLCYPTFVGSDNTHPPTIVDITEDDGIVDGTNHIDPALADGFTTRSDLISQSVLQHKSSLNSSWYDK